VIGQPNVQPNVQPKKEEPTRRSAMWCYEEDKALCTRVIACGGLKSKRLSPTWFKASFAEMPPELSERNIGALILRFYYLHDELMVNMTKGGVLGEGGMSWDWLRDRHLTTQTREYYTYDEDLALCKTIVEKGACGKKVGQKWFKSEVVGKVQCLNGRNASGLYGRFSKRLSKKLNTAVEQSNITGKPLSFKWLKEMHGVAEEEEEEVAQINEEQIQLPVEEVPEKRQIKYPWRCDDEEFEIEFSQNPRNTKRNKVDVVEEEPVPTSFPTFVKTTNTFEKSNNNHNNFL